jgi:hypothetical protein
MNKFTLAMPSEDGYLFQEKYGRIAFDQHTHSCELSRANVQIAYRKICEDLSFALADQAPVILRVSKLGGYKPVKVPILWWVVRKWEDMLTEHAFFSRKEAVEYARKYGICKIHVSKSGLAHGQQIRNWKV